MQGRLTIEKPGKCPGLRAWIPNTPSPVFHVFRLFNVHQNCRAFWLLRLVHRQETDNFGINRFWVTLKELNQTAPRICDPWIRSKSVHPWASAEIFPMGQRRILLILYRLLTMQCKWNERSQNALPFLPQLVCAGWISILNLFYTSAIRNAFSFYFGALSTNKSSFKNNHRLLEEHEGWKNKKVRHSRKTVSSNWEV